jgi:ABC-2 type transport system permease protein
MNTKLLVTQAKRELWENKIRFVNAPIIVTGLLVLVMLIALMKFSGSVGAGGFHFQGGGVIGSGSSEETTPIDANAILAHVVKNGPEVYQQIISGVTYANTSLLCILFIIVILSYAHGCLFDDRKNRDILFWRSLPVSETVNVLVKCGFLLFYFPALMLLLNFAIGLIALLAASIFFIYKGIALGAVIGGVFHSGLFTTSLTIGVSSVLGLLLLMPVIGFMLFCSAFAKKSPFFLGAIIPTVLVVVDRIANAWFGLNIHVVDILTAYGGMLMRAKSAFIPSQIFELDVNSLTALLMSLVIGAGFVAGAIWLRNHRYEI